MNKRTHAHTHTHTITHTNKHTNTQRSPMSTTPRALRCRIAKRCAASLALNVRRGAAPTAGTCCTASPSQAHTCEWDTHGRRCARGRPLPACVGRGACARACACASACVCATEWPEYSPWVRHVHVEVQDAADVEENLQSAYSAMRQGASTAGRRMPGRLANPGADSRLA